MRQQLPNVKSSARLLLLLVLSILCRFSLAAEEDSPEQADSGNVHTGKITFIHIGDPQFGYGLDGTKATADRMQSLTAALMEKNPAFVLVAGDLVQDRTRSQRSSFRKSVENIPVPVILTPGNHDIVNARDLRQFRKNYGEDYSITQIGDLFVMSLNSEVLRDRTISPEEHDSQWRWVEDTIVQYLQYPSDQKRLVLLTHRPPFITRVDEAVTEQNWPVETRIRLLELARKAGVEIICAGHTHTTREISATGYGLTIYTVGGAARVFDSNGTGYRVFNIGMGGYQQEYIRTGTPSDQAGWLGFRQWSPRIFDFSPRHWMWTLLFSAAAFHLLLNVKPAKQNYGAAWGSLLVFFSVWYLFFAINMQFDFDELITELARRGIPDGYFREKRHLITASLFVFTCAVLLIFIFMISRKIKHRQVLIAMALLVTPTLAWFSLQVASNHFMGILWPEWIWDILFGVTLFAQLFLMSYVKNSKTEHTQ